jgi:nucleotide-binding universal stress UspA family protein
MFKTVVWATDGSEAADRALPFAKALVSGNGARLVVVHSKEFFVAGRAGSYPVLADEAELEVKIRQQVADLRDAGFDTTFELVSGGAGHTAHLIAEASSESGADVIVVGTRGHTLVAGLLLGSVTQRLLHIATCPVLAVPSAVEAARPMRAQEKVAAAS